MTIPAERTRAVQYARDFLRALLSRVETPRVPKEIREQALRVLRHFPSDWDLHVAATGAPDSWADPEPAAAHGLTASEPGTYVLKLTAEQAGVLVNACDLYSRIGIGQFEEIENLARMGMIPHKDGEAGADDDYARLDAARFALDAAKKQLTGMASSASFGIHGQLVHKGFKIAWDLQQVIRHRLAWDRMGSPARREWAGTDGKAGMMGVSYDEPHSASGTPLAQMEQASDADILAALPTGYALSRSGYGGDQEWHLLQLPKPRSEGGFGKGTKLALTEVTWVGSGESARAMLAVALDHAKGLQTSAVA